MKYRVVISLREYHEFRVDAESIDEAQDIADERAAADFFGQDYEIEDVFEEE